MSAFGGKADIQLIGSERTIFAALWDHSWDKTVT